MARSVKTKKKTKIVTPKTVKGSFFKSRTPFKPTLLKGRPAAKKTSAKKKVSAAKPRKQKNIPEKKAAIKVIPALKGTRKKAAGRSIPKAAPAFLPRKKVQVLKKKTAVKSAAAVSKPRKSLVKGPKKSAPARSAGIRQAPRVRDMALAPRLAKRPDNVPQPKTPEVRAVKKKKAVPARTRISKKPAANPVSRSAEAPAPAAGKKIPSSAVPLVERELPETYDETMVYLLVRDPEWIYAYWEIRKADLEKGRRSLGSASASTVLRVYDVSETPGRSVYQDLHLDSGVRHRLIHVSPNRSFCAEIGLLHQDGRFFTLAGSNPVHTPPNRMSNVIDEKWMGLDFDKVYALSGGFPAGKTSEELQSLMQERIQGSTSSGSGSGAGGIGGSLSMPTSGSLTGRDNQEDARKFFFWLDCEVIVYGGTEPDAKVTFQGRTIKLRPDGTFSFRFALPDGKFVFDAKAESSDGIEERVITPVVTRETSRPAPVIRPRKRGRD